MNLFKRKSKPETYEPHVRVVPTVTMCRGTYEDAIAMTDRFKKGTVLFELPREGKTKGAIKVSDGVSSYIELPYVLEPGEGPTSPDVILSLVECLTELRDIRRKLCQTTD